MTDTYLPTFQPQNPALSGDKYGWEDCMAFAAAVTGNFDADRDDLTGAQVRRESNEPVPDPSSPGLSLGQVQTVLAKHGIELTPYRGVSFDWAMSVSDAGHALVFAVSYGPIHLTQYSGDWNFTGNHAVGLFPDGHTMDSLTDGRVKPYSAGGGHYPKGFQEIPRTLLRSACGQLQLGVSAARTPIRLGAGKCYVGVLSRTFPYPPPSEDDVRVTKVKAEDWKPKAGRTEAPLRAFPDRTQKGIGAITGTTRTIAEVSGNGENWRLTEYKGAPAYLLRDDLDPLVAGGDPTLDQALTDFIARKA